MGVSARRETADPRLMRFLPTQPLACGRRAQFVLLVLTALLAVVAVEYTFQLSEALRDVIEVVVYNGLVIAAGVVCVARGIVVRRERTAWIAMGVAVLAWGVGNTVWTFTVSGLADPPYPSAAD